jgi:hypothetical protein
MLIFNNPPDLTAPSTSVWSRIKNLISRATPTPARISRGDAHVAAWVQQHARENDAAMPAQPAPVGMVISSEAVAACSAPSPAHMDAIAQHLSAAFPRTPGARPPGI